MSANIAGWLPLLPTLVAENAHAPVISHDTRSNQADLRCGLAAGFFPAACFGFLPAIGINISFCPAAAWRGFFTDFFGPFVSAAAPPTLRRSASIRSTTFSPRGRSFGVIGLPARFWLMRSIRAVSY